MVDRLPPDPAPTASSPGGAVTPDSAPRRGWLRWVLVGVVVVVALFAWLLGSQRGLSLVVDTLQSRLPGGSSLSMNSIEGRLVGPLILRGLEFRSADMSGAVRQLEIDWQPLSLLRGELLIDYVVLEQPRLKVLASADAAANADQEQASVRLPETLTTPVAIRLTELRLVDAGVTLNDQTYSDLHLLLDGHWIDSQLELNVKDAQSPWGAFSAAAALDASGAYPLQLDGSVRARVADLQPLEASVEVDGPLLNPRLHVQVAAPYGVTLEAALANLTAAPSVVGNVSATPASLAQLGSDLPDITPSVQASFSGPFNALTVNGSVDLKGDKIAPLRADYAAQVSDTELHLRRLEVFLSEQGAPLTAVGRLGFAEHLPIELNATAKNLASIVAGSSLEFSDLTLQLGGSMNGYRVKLASGLERAGLDGVIDAEFGVRVKLSADDQWAAGIDNLRVDGEVAGHEITAYGQADLHSAGGTIESLQVRLGENSAELLGELGAEHSLTAAIRLNDLQQFETLVGTPLRGSIRADARLSGDASNPQVSIDATGEQLRIDQSEISEVTLLVGGSAEQHQIGATLAAPAMDVALEMDGAWQSDASWRYLLRDLRVAQSGQNWRLKQASAGQIASSQTRVEETCLMQSASSHGGSVCIEGAQTTANGLSGAVSLRQFQLSALNVLLPDATRLAGEVEGRFELGRRLSDTAGRLSLNAVGLSVRESGEWVTPLAFAPGTFSLQPNAGDLRFELLLPLLDAADGGGIEWTGDLEVRNDQMPNNAALNSTLTFGVSQLSWIERFVEGLGDFSGELSGALQIAGTAGAPRISGESVLSINQASLEATDIELHKSQLTLSGVGDRVQLEGVLRSGEGEVALNGELGLSGSPEFSGTVTGRDFLVSDSREARVMVSPDLSARYGEGVLTLRGEVVVPLAELEFEKLPEGAIAVSKDQRFAQSAEAEVPFVLDAEIDVKLGERVSFEGLGLQARFGGELTVTERSTGTTTGRGEILIREGSYKAYGQDLRVQNGKVIFAGGPVDEPGLDVRAVRQATPDVQVGVHVLGSLRQPKLEVFSTPTLPQSDQLAYLVLGRPLSESSASENTLLQQAAMAIGVEGGTLLTEKLGKNLGVDRIGIESAPGTDNSQAALVVGKYLSPRLYVSYGYGLFEPISTLRLEYQISPLWRIVTESTNEATGGDLIWVRER